MEQEEVSVIERSQLKGVKLEMIGPKLRSGEYLQGALN